MRKGLNLDSKELIAMIFDKKEDLMTFAGGFFDRAYFLIISVLIFKDRGDFSKIEIEHFSRSIVRLYFNIRRSHFQRS